MKTWLETITEKEAQEQVGKALNILYALEDKTEYPPKLGKIINQLQNLKLKI